jgi:L-proline 4-hydroxylase
MKLTDAQRQLFEDDGYLVFPDLFTAEEIAILKRETERLAAIETDHVFRAGDIATVYRCHEKDGSTASEPYHAAARLPRSLGIAEQLLGRGLYIYNSKINLKKAITGSPMLWHQDYGYWKLDRMPEARAATLMIALNDVDEIGGTLYVIPGSHKLGMQKHKPAMVGPHKQIAVEREVEIALMHDLPAPVPLSGRAGMGAIFHCNIIHGSGQNLSPRDRWQVYFAYNPSDNAPPQLAHDRPDYMKSRNTAPLALVGDDALLAAARVPA